LKRRRGESTHPLEWLRRREEKLKQMRRKNADWSYISRQPPRIRLALQYLVETGDYRTAAKIAQLPLEKLILISKEAGIPTAM